VRLIIAMALIRFSFVINYIYQECSLGSMNNAREHLIRFAARNIITIPTLCKRGCVFCFQRQAGEKYGAVDVTQDLTLNDYQEAIRHIDYDKFIYINGGDIFDYPLIYDVLEMLQKEIKKKATTIEIISTFADFNMQKAGLLKDKSMYMVLSGITLNTQLKNSLMANGWTEPQTRNIKALISEGIFRQAIIWDFGQIDVLRQDLIEIKECAAEMARNCPGRILEVVLSYPSTTKFANPIAKQYNQLALENYNQAIELFHSTFKDVPNIQKGVYTLRDLNNDQNYREIPYFLQARGNFRTRVQQAVKFLCDEKISLPETGFVTSAACFEYAKKQFPGLNWVLAGNEYFGGDILSSSLLTFDDIEKAKKYKNYILTKDMLNESGGNADVVKRSILDFEQKNNCKAYFF
jgi:hypothetical protein